MNKLYTIIILLVFTSCCTFSALQARPQLIQNYTPKHDTISANGKQTMNFRVNIFRPLINTVNFQWYLNGVALQNENGDKLSIKSSTIGHGAHFITLTISDSTMDEDYVPETIIESKTWTIHVNDKTISDTYAITGSLLLADGSPVANARIDGGPIGITYTDTLGNYSFNDVMAGSYFEIQPVKEGYTFLPEIKYGYVNSTLSKSFLAYTDNDTIGPDLISHADDQAVELSWTPPTAIGFDSDWVYIRMSTSGYPQDEFDGIEVYSGNATQFLHNELDNGQTYYYRIWAHNEKSYADFPALNKTSATPEDVLFNAADFDLIGMDLHGSYTQWYINNDTLLGAREGNLNIPDGWTIIARTDYYNDGADELIIYDPLSGIIEIWTMQGFDKLSAHQLSYVIPASSGWLLVGFADMNGDNYVDLIWQHQTVSALAYWYMEGINRIGTSSLNNAPSRSTGYSIKGLNDFNGDGHADFLWQHNNGSIAIWHMQDTTILSQEMVYEQVPEFYDWAIVGTGDFNHDGAADLLWHNPTTGSLRLWYMANTILLAHEDIAEPFTSSFLISQHNFLSEPNYMPGETTLLPTDLYWHHTDGRMMHWEMNGITRTAADLFAEQLEHLNGSWELKFMRDINQDGHLDKLWYHPNGTLAIWYMDGLYRTHTASYIYPAPSSASGWQLVGFADMNNDSHNDLVWHHTSASAIAYWYMQGETRLTTATITDNVPTTTSGWQIKGINDFNYDGHNDLLWHHSSGSVIAWHMNNTTRLSFAASNVSVPSSSGWSIYGTGDYNDDGRADILWWHETNGQILHWYMNEMAQDDFAVSSEILPLNSGWKLVPH